MTFTPRTPAIGFIHHHLDDGDIYFLAHTSNEPVSVKARFRFRGTHAEVWDPFTGNAAGLSFSNDILLELAPYESRLVFFSDRFLSPPAEQLTSTSAVIDFGAGWTLAYADGPSNPISSFKSWSDDAEHRFYSGSATYNRKINLSAAEIVPGHSVILAFGPGTPVCIPTPLPHTNMRAYLDSPIREAAEVFVNGQPSGCVWHPPFRVDLSPHVHPCKNELHIVVFNTAINELAGEPLPTYPLLRAKYGVEFIPQGMGNLMPLLSGMITVPRLLIENRSIHGSVPAVSTRKHGCESMQLCSTETIISVSLAKSCCLLVVASTRRGWPRTRQL